ncbi:MAG: hypothetical protein AAGN35_21620 [Bacteroidota bacterium]
MSTPPPSERSSGPRILIIGSPGSGKSTLATQLHAATQLPLIRLDQEYWQPGWVEPDRATWRARVAELAQRERWIMEGNYGGTFDLRIPRADLVVYLDLPTRVTLLRVIRRVWKHRGHSRPDMPEGCPEHFSLKFLFYVLHFRASRRAGILARLDKLRPDQERAHLTGKTAVKQFLRQWQ